MDVMEYIVQEALIVIPVLNSIGFLLKKRIVDDWIIPFVLLPIGIILCGVILQSVLDGIIQGVLVTGTSVFLHQLQLQYKKQF